MKQRGFTIVELAITITIMAILLTLAVANLNSTQANGRDAERVADVGAIANHLEVFYKDGYAPAIPTGRYPSTVLMSGGEASMKALLPDIDLTSVTAPDATNASASFIAATNTIQTTAGVLPQPTISQYVYQPLQTNGALCTIETQECRKFAIYYRTEVDNTVKKIISKNQ